MTKFSDVIDYVAGNGFFYLFLIFLVNGCNIPVAMMHTSAVFISNTPKFRCYIDEIDNPNHRWNHNVTRNNITYIFLPWREGKQSYDSCHRKIYNTSSCNEANIECIRGLVETNASYTSETCNGSYVFDQSVFKSTTVTEWNLVCDRTTLKTISTSIYFLGVFFGSVIGGVLSDKFGRIFVLRIASVISAIIIALNGISPNIYVFYLLQFLTGGVCMGTIMSSVVYAIEIAKEEHRLIAGLFCNILFGAGCALFSVVAYFIRDWRNIEFAVALIFVPCIIDVFIMVESPRWLYGRNRMDEAKQSCKRIARMNGVKFDDGMWDNLNDKPKSSEESHNSLTEIFVRPYSRFLICGVMFIWAVTSLVYYGLILNGGSLAGDIFWNNALGGLVEVFADITFYFMVLKVGVRNLVATTLYIASFSCIASTIVAQTGSGNTALETLGLIFAMIGRFGTSGSFAMIYIQCPQLFPTSGRTTALGLSSMAARIGSILSPFTIQVQEDIPWLSPVIFGILAFFAASLALTFPRTSGRPLTMNFDEAEEVFKTHYQKNVFPRIPFMKTKRVTAETDLEETKKMVSADLPSTAYTSDC
ncbi:organic cation transporter-like protein [Ciona intestinalis]